MTFESHRFISIVCTHCGNSFTVPAPCGNRFCPTCSAPRSKRVRFKLSEFIKRLQLGPGESFKLLTLSIQSSPDLKKQLGLLLSSFRRLRQRSFWRRHVSGGAFVVELTHTDRGWHAHLHIIIQSRFVPWSKLLVHWQSVSGGSGCHIKRIPPQAIIRYVTKYITKSELPEDLQCAASEALRSRRMFQPFGSWHAPINSIVVPKATCSHCGRVAFDWNPYQSVYEYVAHLPDPPVELPPRIVVPEKQFDRTLTFSFG